MPAIACKFALCLPSACAREIMSNGSRRQSLGKRGGRGQKQAGTSGNFTRVERKEVEMQENPMLIQLDSDDPVSIFKIIMLVINI